MPIDPQVQAFLDRLEAQRAPPLWSLTPEQARAAAVLGAVGLGPPERVAKIEDRRVPAGDREIPVRIYTPRGRPPFPVLVYFHGGGWVLGDIGTHDALCCSITNSAGCAVVSVGYRLAPEHKYPAAVLDAYAATEWVFGQGGVFGGDAARVAVGGDSAGGNLAAVVALKARDQAAFRPVFQLLIYPITDFRLDTPSYGENAQGYMLTRDDMEWFWRSYLPDERSGRQPYASPLRAEDLGGLPPALVITAEYDPLRDEGEAYAARLRQAGVPVTLTRYDGMIHGFLRRAAIFDRAKIALEAIATSLRHAFE